MADFCSQCSKELFGEDFSDLAGLFEPTAEAQSIPALCEGCGPTAVNAAGECIYHDGKTSAECLAEGASENVKGGSNDQT